MYLSALLIFVSTEQWVVDTVVYVIQFCKDLLFLISEQGTVCNESFFQMIAPSLK